MADFGVTEGIALAGVAVSVATAAAAGAAQYSSAKYNQQAAENNATAATQQAALDAGQKAEEGQQLLAKQAATASADGVDVNSGSLLDVEEDSSVNNEMQQQLIKYRGQVNANQDYAQAGLDSLQANNAIFGAGVSAAGGIAQGAASYYRNTLLTSGSSDTSQNPEFYA